MTSPFEILDYEAQRFSSYYGVRPELVILHAVSLAAAMARRVVRTDGWPPVLPLLIRTAQTAPCWLEREWQEVEGQQDVASRNPCILHPMTVAAIRRRQRILKIIAPDHLVDLTALANQIRANNTRPIIGRMVLTRNAGRPAVQSGGQPLTHMAATLPRYRTVLRRVVANPTGESLIGWMNSRDFNNLVRSEGPEIIRYVGLVLPLPEVHEPTPRIEPPPPLMAMLHDRFIRAAMTAKNKWAFSPEGEALAMLDAHDQRNERLLASLPAELCEARPDPLIARNIAAVLAFLFEGKDQKIDEQAVAMAIKLTEWAVGEHLWSIRLAWPADNQGLFAGQDLQVFRQMTASPQPLRNLQRALKGVDKARCQAAVCRAIAAGLAIEQPANRFALAGAQPSETSDLSEQESPPHPIDRESCPEITDVTDNPAVFR